MDTWGWIAVYAVGLAVLQLLMYRYLARQGDALSGSTALSGGDGDEESRGSRPTSAPPDRTHWMDQDYLGPIDRPRRGPGDARTCPYCGVENEPERAFTRCWNCTGRLE